MAKVRSKKSQGGAPAWVMTYADLMSLLMVFFVMLLSLSEMDLVKFKKVTGSVDRAFGIQRKIRAFEIPKGQTIVRKNFTPGRPVPTVTEEIRQRTTRENLDKMDISRMEVKEVQEIAKSVAHALSKKITELQNERQEIDQEQRDNMRQIRKEIARMKAQVEHASGKLDVLDASHLPRFVDRLTPEERAYLKEQITEAENLELARKAQELAEQFAQEIQQGQIEVEVSQGSLILRIMEKGAFESASDALDESFLPILIKIHEVISHHKGTIRVIGHTDNLPIYTHRFRSNWDLSCARAVSVVHEFLAMGMDDPRRLMAMGKADLEPLLPNTSEENRSRNRRVEIILRQGPVAVIRDRLFTPDTPGIDLSAPPEPPQDDPPPQDGDTQEQAQ